MCVECSTHTVYSLFHVENTEGDVSHATLGIIKVKNGLRVETGEQADVSGSRLRGEREKQAVGSIGHGKRLTV